jgi:hypothetical protein
MSPCLRPYLRGRKRCIVFGLRLRGSHEAEEIVHHAIVGGTIAVILTAAEILQRGRLEHWSQVHPWKFLILVLIAGLFGSFFLLLIIESVWRLRRRIVLPGIKTDVNGVWIYKAKDVGSDIWNRVSVAHIEGSGWGFKFDGRSYTRDDLQGDEPLSEHGSGYFRGAGSLWIGGDRFYFRYNGGERDSARVFRGDEGVGYYDFFSSSGQLFLRGAFTGSLGPDREMVTRTTEGRRVESTITKQLLREALGDPSPAGGFAGTWVDVIYEKVEASTPDQSPPSPLWKLIQGSIIRITPDEAQARSFQIEGWSYSRDVIESDDLAPDQGAWNTNLDFHGQGRLAENTHYPVLYYLFGGHESQTGEGVARYELHADPNGHQTFLGEFTRGQESPVRIVFGKKVKSLKPEEELRAYFKTCRRVPPADFL